MALERVVLAMGLAAALAGCGGAQTSLSNVMAPGAGTAPAARSDSSPPDVAGTYKGRYTETRNGQTVKGRVRIVINQVQSKIRGPFDIRGAHNPLNTFFAGKVRQGAHGVTVHFYAGMLAGYDNSVNFHGHVAGTTLSAAGHSQATSGSQASYWEFVATKT